MVFPLMFFLPGLAENVITAKRACKHAGETETCRRTPGLAAMQGEER
jgi:hypothetical protein